GIFGTPRRHWDSTFSGAPFGIELLPIVSLFQAGLGIGGLVAAAAVLAFIAIAVVTVFFGKTVTADDLKNGASGLPQGVLKLPAQQHRGEAVASVHLSGARGTMVLVFIFLACFMIYYFTNWKLLSFLWKVG